MRKLSVSIVLALWAGLVTAGAAGATGSVAMSVDVQASNKSVQDEQNGTCRWEVTSRVDVVNLTKLPRSITGVGYAVSWTGPGNTSGVQNDVTVVQNGGLQPGIILAPNERRTFSPVTLQFGIPCQASTGDLAVRLTTPEGTASGDAPFLDGGAPVPAGAAGAIGLATLVGIGLVVRHRRRQPTPLPVTIDPPRSAGNQGR